MAYDIEYSEDLEAVVFRAKHKNDKDNATEVVVPLKLLVGVTGALCGFFILLIPLPIPGKAQVGTFLVTTGLKYSCDAVIKALEEKEKQKQ